ncbi:MAG: ABC transporter substrate-binding protein [bacterium]|nr:ABC transporter substrate-binding protein [bacterium]
MERYPVKDKKILVIGQDSDPIELDPGISNHYVSEAIINQIFDYFIRLDDSLKPIPWIAESWDVSPGELDYEFKVKTGIKFHNGDPLTVEDIKFTFDRIKSPSLNSPLSDEINSIKYIEIIDENKIRFHLKYQYPPFLYTIFRQIVPKTYIARVGDESFKKNPVGSGPYIFKSWEPGKEVVLEKNENYWAGKPNFSKIFFIPFDDDNERLARVKEGDIDIALEVDSPLLEKLMNEKNININETKGLSYYYLGFSCKTPVYKDVRFRKAFYHSINWDELIGEKFGTYGINRVYSIIPDVLWPDDLEYLKSKVLEFNPEKSVKLLNELKSEKIINDSFRPTIYCVNDPHREEFVATIADLFKKNTGYVMESYSLPWETLDEKTQKGEVGIFFSAWIDKPDPDFYAYSLLHGKSPQNDCKYDNFSVNISLLKARSKSEQSFRAIFYKDAVRQALTRDYIHIPLFTISETLVSRKNIKGLRVKSNGLFELFYFDGQVTKL